MSIFELNKIMSSMLGMKRIGTAVVESTYNGTYYSEQAFSFGDVLHSALCFGLLDVDGSNISVTDVGAAFADMMHTQNGNLVLNHTAEQRKFLVKCLDSVRIHDMCASVFKKFRVNYSIDPPVWNSNVSALDRFESCLFGILEEIEIIKRDRNIVMIGMENARILSAIKNGLPINEDYMSDRMKDIGNAGENMAICHEMERLSGIKRDDLSEMVEQVSLVDPYVGYDIASFDGYSSDESLHDRFIEVKSTTGTTPKFFWSRNEVNVAQKYGDRYWIYLWTDVEGSAALHMIQNPYTELFETGELKPEPYAYVIDKHVLRHANIVKWNR